MTKKLSDSEVEIKEKRSLAVVMGRTQYWACTPVKELRDALLHRKYQMLCIDCKNDCKVYAALDSSFQCFDKVKKEK